MVLLDKFPHGSTSDVSEAKDNIWTDWANFKMGLQKLSRDAEDLAINAKIGDTAGTQAAFLEMAGVCKTCHKVFREKK